MSQLIAGHGDRVVKGAGTPPLLQQSDSDRHLTPWIIGIVLLAAASVFTVGVVTEFCLGDEFYHWRFAKDIFKAGHRVTYDPVYESGLPPGCFYSVDALWHIGLAFLWKLTGGVQQWTAQLYQASWLFALLSFTWLFARQRGSSKEAFWAVASLAGLPVVVVFSILFYIDLPGACVSLISLWLITKRRFGWAGLAWGLAFMTKRMTVVVTPTFLVCEILLCKMGWGTRLRTFLTFLLPGLAIIIPEILWREAHFRVSDFASSASGTVIDAVKHIRNSPIFTWIWRSPGLSDSDLINPLDLLRYFGIVTPLALLIFGVNRVGSILKRDAPVAITVFVYAVFSAILFSLHMDIRYLFPIVPLIAYFTGRVLAQISGRALPILVSLLLAIQFVSTTGYTFSRRRITEPVKAAFAFIRETTPEKSVIVYPGGVSLEATERRIVWGRILNFQEFFWPSTPESWRRVVQRNGIDYIAVKKTRVYDDRKERSLKGYPKSFVDRLPELPGVSRVFENSDVSIWKVASEAKP